MLFTLGPCTEEIRLQSYPSRKNKDARRGWGTQIFELCTHLGEQY